jgi:integrase
MLRRVGAAFANARRLLEPEDHDAIRELTLEVTRLARELREERVRAVTAANQIAPPAGPTIAELCEWWFETKAFTKLQSGRDRRHNIEAHILPLLGEHTQATLTSDDVEDALEVARKRHGLSAQTLNHIRAALAKVINDAAKRQPPKWTSPNPVRGVARYEVEDRDPPMLTAPQAGALIRAASPHWRPIFAVAIYLGLRAGEIRGLKNEDVDVLHKRLHVKRSGRRETTKTGKARVIPVPDELWPILLAAKRAKAGGEALFGHGGHPLSKNWKSANLMRATLKKAGLVASVRWICNHKKGCGAAFDEEVEGGWCPSCSHKLRRTTKPLEMDFHDLRHVSATLHQEAGCHMWVMTKVLGHAMPKVMTMRYTHLPEDKVRQELNRLSILSDLSTPPPDGTGGGAGPGSENEPQGDTQMNMSARSSDWIEHRPSKPMPMVIRGTPEESESLVARRAARFWSAVRRGSPAGCWLWAGGDVGLTRVFGRQESVRRVAWRLTRGALGQKQAVLASCGDDLCCNPDHLFTVPLGSPRSAAGTANGRAKLTPLMVAEIRRAYAAGERTIKELSVLNGVSPRAIRKVVDGTSWRGE